MRSRSRSAQLATHVATLPTWGTVTLTRSEIDLGQQSGRRGAVEEPSCWRHSTRTSRSPRGDRRQDRCRADGPMVAETQRQDGFLDAQDAVLAFVRDESPDPSPRTVERLSAPARRSASVDLRSERGRAASDDAAWLNVRQTQPSAIRRCRHRTSRSAVGTCAIRIGGMLFLFLATANGAGYRYGVSDQAFYIPAVVARADAGAFSARRGPSSTLKAG